MTATQSSDNNNLNLNKKLKSLKKVVMARRHNRHKICTYCPNKSNFLKPTSLLTTSFSYLLLATLTQLNTDSATHVVKPTTRAATFIPGQPLHFECGQIGETNPQFVWYKRELGQEDKHLLQPNEDDTIEIHNERLTLTKPNFNSLGDYICSALPENVTEFAVIRVRAQPYIEDFGIETSHTGRSATIKDGERLELLCRVLDRLAPVNITWLRSDNSDDERLMVPLPEIDSKQLLLSSSSQDHLPTVTNALTSSGDLLSLGAQSAGISTQMANGFEKTYSAPSIIVEKIDEFTKKLIIEQVGPEHRGHYTCLVDNGVTERSRKTIFIRVKDRIVALWPFLAILAELFILFTIIHVWETRKAYKEAAHQQQPSNSSSSSSSAAAAAAAAAAVAGPGGGGVASRSATSDQARKGPLSSSKRAPSGPANAFESVPLTSS